MSRMAGCRMLLCLLTGLLLAGPLRALEEDGATEGRRALPFSLLNDAGGMLTVDEVAGAHAGDFVAYDAGTQNLGYRKGAVWMRVTLDNTSPDARRFYLDIGPPRLRDVRIFEPLAEGGWREYATGLEVPVQQRELASRQPLLRTALLQPGETRTVYARIVSENAVALEADLWVPRAFLAWESRLDQINLFQLGGLAALTIFAVLVGVFAREPLFLLFAAGMFSAGMFEVSILQYGHQWLWPTAPDWSMRSPGVAVVLSISTVTALISQLVRRISTGSRWLLLLDIQAVLAIALLPAMIWAENYALVMRSAGALGISLVIGCSMACLAVYSRDRSASLTLMVAFLMLWVITIIRVLQFNGIFPQEVMSFDYSWAMAPLVSGLLMASILARDILAMRRMKEKAQRNALLVATRAREQLEVEVAARTQDVQAALQRAEEASAAKSRFLAQLSHEFRTPLHGVLGYAALMAEEERGGADQRRLAAIQRSGNHLLTLIDELLEFSRLEAGRAPLYVHPVNLPAFLRAVVDEVQPLAGAQGIALGLEIPADLPEGVLLDETRLRQVLLNLLANACRHSGGRHVALMARVESQAADTPRLYLGVRDDGVGLSDDDQQHIFDLFWQRPGTDSGGLGLGLPIARQWIRHMGGELAVVSAEGAGSLFHFRLTVPLADAPPAPMTQRLGTGTYEVLLPGRPRVLAVDDQEVNRELMADMLRSAGCEPLVAASGADALDALAGGDVVFALVDQMMPGMDGWTLLQRAREAGVDVPFVLVSAAAPTPPAGWSGEYRFADFVGKPVPPSQLRNLVARFASGKTVAGPVPVARSGAGAEPVRPSAAALARLRQAAALGLISDIDDWLRETRAAEPEAAGFIAAVESALARIDLGAIERLASGE